MLPDKNESLEGSETSEDEEKDEVTAESIGTDTESESESDEPSTDSEEVEDDDESEAGHNIDDEDETELSEEEEFDLDKYIEKLCQQSTDEDESDDDDESDTDSVYSKDTKKAVKKVVRKLSKNNGDDSTDSEDDDDDTLSSPDLNRDDLSTSEIADNASTADKDREGDVESGDDDDSSFMSSGESDVDYLYDDDDDDDDDSASSTGTSQNGDDADDSNDPESSIKLGDELLSPTNDPKNQPHDAVRKYYQDLEREKCPAKLDVTEHEIGNMKLDSALTSRSVVSLRWPFSNYYVKEFDVEYEERDSVFDEGLLPTYKSMQSSASLPGRRRNVMSGRIWWVEWWANNLSDSGRSGEDFQPKDSIDDLPEFEQLSDNESISESSHL